MRSITTRSLLVFGAVISIASAAPDITWFQCPPNPTLGPGHGLDCGEVVVPLDHDHPTGETIKLGFTRLNATGSEPRGNLFLQSGGPGISTSLQPRYQVFFEETGNIIYRYFSPELREAYNLIGLDMRGEGMSQPIFCDPDIYNQPHTLMATDEKSFAQLWERNRAFAESCYNMTGPFFRYLGTDQVIQDVDLVRRALGDEKFYYFGYSYGTQLGAQYAARYPNAIGRMVLDGNLDHSMTVPQSWIELAVALENAVEFFFRWCNTTTSCALYGQDLPAIWDGIIKHAEDGTLVDAPCEELGTCKTNLTVEDFVTSAQGVLSTGNLKKNIPGATTDYFVLAEMLEAARDGNATVFRVPYVTSNSSTDLTTGSFYSFPAIFCSDWNHSIRSVGDMKAIAAAVHALTPRTRGLGTMAIGQGGCVGWPFEPTDPQHRLEFDEDANVPPIMIVGSFYDEATSVQWSVAQRWMIPNSFNVWRNGGGHTDYHFMGDTQKAIDAYLINGTIPEDGSVYQT